MNLQFSYGELEENTDFVNICDNLKEGINEIQEILDKLLPLKAQYNKMSLPAQIELDLFLAFTLNSLQWVNLRVQGMDPTTHPVKDELLRIRAVMSKWQEYKDRDNRPTVNIDAAKRFIRSGLYDRYRSDDGEPPNKKKMLSKRDSAES
ncbi:nuclear nucleic acid-binding protein C1D [Epargyreus clarus]|uniref:nuclear nucleic acid-binding protein C1D n=1 Tax=Epargyreus clarus TaxID=520877 RepID=UPI003C2BC559